MTLIPSLIFASVAVLANTSSAATPLEQAAAYVRAREWQSASATLTPLVKSGCVAPAFYLSGVVAANRADPKGTIEAETQALACSPPLEANYRSGAVKLLQWAVEELRQPVVIVHFGQSVENADEQKELDRVANAQLGFKRDDLITRALAADPSVGKGQQEPKIRSCERGKSDDAPCNSTTHGWSKPAPLVALPETGIDIERGSIGAKIGPREQLKTLIETPDDYLFFIVRADQLELNRVGKMVGTSLIDDFSSISAIGVKLKSSEAISIAGRTGVDQVWYVDRDIYKDYAGIIHGIEKSEGAKIINVSLAPPVDFIPMPSNENEPMNAETRVAADRGGVVVMPIGNYANGKNAGIVNPWCRPAWVICVGATTRDGKKLAAFSARGDAANPNTWPTFVAVGAGMIIRRSSQYPKTPDQVQRDESDPIFISKIPQSERNSYTVMSGTSFAVPAVSVSADLILGCIEKIGRFGRISTNAPIFILEMPLSRYAETEKLGRLTGDVNGAADGKVRVTYRSVEWWKLVKQLLVDTAIPMDGYSPAEVGAGFVSPNRIGQIFQRCDRAPLELTLPN